MMQTIKKLFFVLFVCSLMAGCAGLGPGKVPFNDPRVTVVGSFLRSDIKVTGLNTRINSGNFMEVQVTGTNKATGYRNTNATSGHRNNSTATSANTANASTGYRNLEYKIDWIDRDGFVIKTILSRWTQFPAYASSTFSFAGVAPKTSASDFRITIRKKEK